MESIVEQMQDDQTGVPVRTVKSFMSKIPSVFTGEYTWIHQQTAVTSYTESESLFLILF